MQIPVIGRLADQRVVTAGYSPLWEFGIICPGPLDELEPVIDATLVAGEEETTFAGLIDGEFGPIRDPIPDHTSISSFVGIVAGVHLTYMRG